MRIGPSIRIVCLALVAFALAASAAENGSIEGRVTAKDGRGHGGIEVRVEGTQLITLTDAAGRYELSDVPPGTYTVAFQHRDRSIERTDVIVVANQVTVLDVPTEWDVTIVESMTVYSASRREERVVDAPAAVTVIDETQVEEKAASGQLPKLLEFTPGAEVTQSGLYDYNFNTRGFNSSLNRRVATLVDGRDPSVPFLGAQEWASLTGLDDVASLEFVRGPSAALYGANASSGVLNITSKDPRYSEGGMVRLTAGELETLNGDFRYAGPLGNEWYWKVNAGAHTSGDFSVSRNGAAEYSTPCTVPGQTDCLPQEAVPLAREDDDELYFGSLRFDKYFGGAARHLTLEGGLSDIAGPLFQTGIGRVQVLDVQRPWGRVNFAIPHWNFLAAYSGRDAPEQLALASGANIALDDSRTKLEVQTNWDLGARMRVVGGASYTKDELDSQDPDTGLQTALFERVDADYQALFGQFDWKVTDTVKLVFAARYDESSLYDAQFSPKAAIVWNFVPNHTLRFTYNEAFQVANYSEFFLQAPVAAPANLAALEGLCLASGVTDCGLANPVPVLALGNEDLELEETTTYEIGYSGIFGGKTFLTVDYYSSENTNFITDLLPQLGTPLGRINPNFGPWVGSASAESTPCVANPLVSVADCVRANAPAILTNNLDGAALLGAVSYTNFGEVDTEGVDVGLSYYFTDKWSVSASYSWFDYEIQDSVAGLDQLLVPNTPEDKAALGIQYRGGAFDAGISGRWVDDFRWVVGPFQGDVLSYTTVDLVANYRLSKSFTVGVNVANLLDDNHWESFGGDLLGRRALGLVAYSW
jgi:outer membrane receptor for ferrienterochelin and colicins